VVLGNARVGQLLESIAAPAGLRTARTPEYLRWRYGLPALGYRAIALDDNPAAGVAVFRLRRRGDAVEAGVSDVIVPAGARAGERQLLRAVARQTGADYAIRVGRANLRVGYVPFPRQGPLLTWRTLADHSAPPTPRDLELSLGDVELL
jgi:hypothetical protein